MKERVLKSSEDFKAWKDDCICSCDTADDPKEYPCLAKTYVSDWQCEEETAEYLYRDDIIKLLKDFDT